MYVAITDASPTNPDTVQILNPYTGALGKTAYVGPGLNLVPVSPTSQSVYASQSGEGEATNPAANVLRFALPALTPDITIPLADHNSDVLAAYDLQPSPFADGTVAVATPSFGVAIYDDSTPRPAQFTDTSNLGRLNTLQWKEDGSELYAANYDSGQVQPLYTIPVTSSGLSAFIQAGQLSDASGGPDGFQINIHYDSLTHCIYDNVRDVIDPISGASVGKFQANALLMVPDGKLNTAFFLTQNITPGVSNTYTIQSFNMTTFAPIATITVPVSGDDLNDTAYHFIRWGADGLAFNTGPDLLFLTGKVYLIRGTFVNPASPIQTPAPAP